MSPAGASWHLLAPPTPLLIVVAAALLLLAVLLYRRTEPPLAPRAKRTLFALRVAGILVLVVLLLQPVLSLFSERRVPARLALLIDGSLSMSIPFREPNAATAGPTTRADAVWDALTKDDGRFLAELREKGRLEIFRFGAELAPVGELTERAALAPRDDRTDLARALSEGVGFAAPITGAAIVLSDGAHNVGADPRTGARRLGVPVYTVGVGTETPLSDVSIPEIVAAGVSYVNNEVPIVAKVRSRGSGRGNVPVYLSQGEAVLDSVRVDLPGAGAEREVELHYVPTEEGTQRYRVWTPAQPEEISADNNEHLFAVRVLKEKIRVLFVTARPSYESAFLKRALEDDISLAVDTIILSLASAEGRLGGRAARFPDAYSELAAYDVVVMLDVGADDLPAAKQRDLERFVSERGGALLVMGMTEAFAFAGSPIASVLPVVATRAARSHKGQILPHLTAAGLLHPVTRLADDRAGNRLRWEQLPPLGAVPLLLDLKPNARVLVQGAIGGIPREDIPLLIVSDGARGRVLALCGSPYWRWDLYLWGSGRSGDVFRRLVARAARWLVARDELKQVMIRPVKSLFEGAEEIVIEAQVYDDDFRPVPGADVRATIHGPTGAEGASRELALVDLQGGRYRGTLPSLPPGDYRIEGRVSLGEETLGADSAEMSVAPFLVEFDDPEPDFEMLREISRASGGRFLSFAELGALPALLDTEPVVERSLRDLALGEHPVLFVLLLALFGIEWAARKRRGLP